MSNLPIWARWLRVFAYGGAISGTGVLLYIYATPSDEELIAAFSPEVRSNYEKNKLLRQQEQQELMALVKKTAASNDPIWKTDKILSPFEKEGRGVDPKLVDIRQFEKDQALKFQQQQVAQSEQELQETERLIKQNRSWWKFW